MEAGGEGSRPYRPCHLNTDDVDVDEVRTDQALKESLKSGMHMEQDAPAYFHVVLHTPLTCLNRPSS